MWTWEKWHWRGTPNSPKPQYYWNFSIHIYPTPSLGQDMTQGQHLSGVSTVLNSEFSFSQTSCLTKVEEPSLLYNLPIAGGRIIGFIPFPRVLVWCETQSASSMIWTRIAVSISYNDNHYTIRLFGVISRTLVGGEVLPLCGEAVGVFFSLIRQGESMFAFHVAMHSTILSLAIVKS